MGQTSYLPPYKIVSLGRTNQNLALAWETVMNNRYRMQYAQDILTPPPWPWVDLGPARDPKLAASGASYTLKTNLLSLFTFDPTFNPNGPLYFRIYSDPFQP